MGTCNGPRLAGRRVRVVGADRKRVRACLSYISGGDGRGLHRCCVDGADQIWFVSCARLERACFMAVGKAEPRLQPTAAESVTIWSFPAALDLRTARYVRVQGVGPGSCRVRTVGKACSRSGSADSTLNALIFTQARQGVGLGIGRPRRDFSEGEERRRICDHVAQNVAPDRVGHR